MTEQNTRDGSNVVVLTRWSRNYGAWLVNVRHGRHGPEITFRASYARHIADLIHDATDQLEQNGNNIE